jgi:tyrosine-protein kinase
MNRLATPLRPERDWREPDRGPDTETDEAAAAAAFAGYMRALRRHPLVLTVIVVVAFVESLVLLQFRHPHYQATARILVTPLPDSATAYDGLPLVRETAGGQSSIYVATAASELHTSAATKLAATRLHSTPAAVNAAVTVTPMPGQSIVEVKATSTSPAASAAIANAYAEAALTARRQTLRPLVASMLARTSTELANLHDPTGTTADALRLKLATLRASATGSDPTLSPLTTASAPSTPTGYPRSMILAVAVAFQLLIGVMTIILLELLVPPLINEEDELREVWPLPILARIPADASVLLHGGNGGGAETTPALRDAYRMLRAQLDLRADGQGVIAFVSPSHGDGRTSAAVNLALSEERGHASVLLVDLDVRRPAVAARLGVTMPQGLSNVLTGLDTVEHATRAAPDHPGVSVLGSTRPSTEETRELISGRSAEIVNAARALADWVIVDTAPLGEVSDALGVLNVADDLVVVVRLGHTTQRSLAELRELVERLGAVPVGIVVVNAGHAS